MSNNALDGCSINNTTPSPNILSASLHWIGVLMRNAPGVHPVSNKRMRRTSNQQQQHLHHHSSIHREIAFRAHIHTQQERVRITIHGHRTHHSRITFHSSTTHTLSLSSQVRLSLITGLTFLTLLVVENPSPRRNCSAPTMPPPTPWCERSVPKLSRPPRNVSRGL